MNHLKHSNQWAIHGQELFLTSSEMCGRKDMTTRANKEEWNWITNTQNHHTQGYKLLLNFIRLIMIQSPLLSWSLFNRGQPCTLELLKSIVIISFILLLWKLIGTALVEGSVAPTHAVWLCVQISPVHYYIIIDEEGSENPAHKNQGPQKKLGSPTLVSAVLEAE